MDCDNARLYLPYLTPGGKDLDGAEADELRAHLEQCSACNALAMNTRRLDQHLSRAMRAVEVPAGMKSRVSARLADDRRAKYRLWAKRASRYAAVAATLLVLALGLYLWDKHRNEKVYTSVLLPSASAGGHNQAQMNDALVHLGAPKNAAPKFNYAYLFGEPALAELPGYDNRKVPQLTFIRQPTTLTKPHNEPQVAIVYVIPKGQYRVEPDSPRDAGYRYKIDVRPGNDCQYLILFNGENYDWLESSDEQ